MNGMNTGFPQTSNKLEVDREVTRAAFVLGETCASRKSSFAELHGRINARINVYTYCVCTSQSCEGSKLRYIERESDSLCRRMLRDGSLFRGAFMKA